MELKGVNAWHESIIFHTFASKCATFMKPSIWTNLLDLVSPRRCAVCGNRLSPTESLLCVGCDLELEVTPFSLSPYDNPMARLFWGQFPIEKASAWFYYRSHAAPSKMIYDLKYHGEALLGEDIGEEMARRHQPSGFFDGIDAIVPIPISRDRRRQRGYNQSEMLARGISIATCLPVYDHVVSRLQFVKSQTHQSSWERRENVSGAFQLNDPEKIRGKHLLLVDDIVTTGSTVIACAQTLAQAEGLRFSVLAVGFTKE